MSKRKYLSGDNDLREFENEVSKAGQVGSGSRHASYFIVINEGAMQGYTPQAFYDMLPSLVEQRLNVEFYAYNMEINTAGSYHIHLYLELEGNGIRFKTMQNIFPGAHIELRRGSPVQALTYLQKPEGVLFSGKEKSHTVVIPVVTKGDFAPFALLKFRRKSETAKMSSQDKFEHYLETCDNYEEVKYKDVHFATVNQKALIEAFTEKKFSQFVNSPNVTTFTNGNGDKCYTVDRKVYYLWGTSRVGKSHGIDRKFGEVNVSKIVNLRRDMKFDNYRNTPVMVMDEFYGQLQIDEALCVLDDKISPLPCRYADKLNMTTTIVLTSNVHLDNQYADLDPARRYAFLKRLTGGVWYMYRGAANDAEKKLRDEYHTGVRYIACHTDGSLRKYNQDGFAPCEPPVYVDGQEVVLVTFQELIKIMSMDKSSSVYCAA